jgi:catalase
VNAFQFINSAGVSHFIRYQFIPLDGEEILTTEQFSAVGPDYLFDELKQRVQRNPIRFALYAQIAIEGDKIEDPSIAWPVSRKKVLLGTVTLDALTSNTVDEDKLLAFSPGNLPSGIQTADPMLDFRTRSYPISIKGRQ